MESVQICNKFYQRQRSPLLTKVEFKVLESFSLGVASKDLIAYCLRISTIYLAEKGHIFGDWSASLMSGVRVVD